MNIWEQERQHFPLIQNEGIYLDHSTSGLIADYSYEAMNHVLRQRMLHGMNIDEYFEHWKFMDELREKLGKMFNCESSQVVYGISSTHLLNILANGLKWEPGDNVLTTDITYPGDSYIWLNKEAEGVAVRFAKTKDAYISAEELMSYADERTRVVCITMVENRFGFRHDLEAIGMMCRQRGIIFAVDGTQGANALYINMKRMNIDFLALSGYKWLMSEAGVGVACIEESLLQRLSQSQVGWVGTVNRRQNNCQRLELSNEAKRFECGGLNFSGYYGLEQVVERNLKLGGEEIERYIMSMVHQVYERAALELTKIHIYGGFPPLNRAQVITFVTPDELEVTTMGLQKMGLRCRVFDNHLIRVGFHYCNIPSDIDALFNCLKELELQI